MKILFLTPYPPASTRGGGEQRMYQLLRYAAAHHDVSLLTLAAPDADLAPLKALCEVVTLPSPTHTAGRRLRALALSMVPDMVVRGQDRHFTAALATILHQQDFDIVQCESIEMSQYHWPARWADANSPGRHRPLFCYDAWNAEHVLQRRAFSTALRHPRTWPAAGYSLVQWQKLRHHERGLADHFNLVFAVSEGDRATLQRLAPGLPVDLVPNGVDTSFFHPRPAAAPVDQTAPLMLFTGTLDFRANIDALAWFVDGVWARLRDRHPQIRLAIVGQRPVAAVQRLGNREGIDVVGPVDDIRPWFERAQVYILPMRIGGGVRLKLLETWAMGVPCVTTTRGAEGVPEFVPGTHALVADDPASFAQAISQLLAQRGLAAQLATAARELVFAHYDWQPIAARMEQSWESLRANRRRTRSGVDPMPANVPPPVLSPAGDRRPTEDE